MRVLITGGMGFIGSRLARKLVADNRISGVTLFDNLSPQIHGNLDPENVVLPDGIRFQFGDVRDKEALHAALHEHDIVVHLAAETGTGQSMYEVGRYEAVNIGGTANLVDFIVNNPASRIRRVVVASSRAIYGEGQYRCETHGTVFPGQRDSADMEQGFFEPRCPKCGRFVEVEKTDEECPRSPASFYGLTKQVQEEMVLMFARSCGISGVALRYQNVYGPGQSLINPYTGLLAVFSNLARVGKPIQVFEDGLESRDFVYIDDIVSATCCAVLADDLPTKAYNVGSGIATKVVDVAHMVNEYFGGNSKVEVTGAFRVGDIRHNIANLEASSAALGFKPVWDFRDGLNLFLDWAVESELRPDGAFEQSLDEMRARGLYRERN